MEDLYRIMKTKLDIIPKRETINYSFVTISKSLRDSVARSMPYATLVTTFLGVIRENIIKEEYQWKTVENKNH